MTCAQQGWLVGVGMGEGGLLTQVLVGRHAPKATCNYSNQYSTGIFLSEYSISLVNRSRSSPSFIVKILILWIMIVSLR